jgi:hypothetical protein
MADIEKLIGKKFELEALELEADRKPAGGSTTASAPGARETTKAAARSAGPPSARAARRPPRLAPCRARQPTLVRQALRAHPRRRRQTVWEDTAKPAASSRLAQHQDRARRCRPCSRPCCARGERLSRRFIRPATALVHSGRWMHARQPVPSWASRAAVRQPPHTQPVSSASRSARRTSPSVDQWPKAMRVPALRRPAPRTRAGSPGRRGRAVLGVELHHPVSGAKAQPCQALTITRSRSPSQMVVASARVGCRTCCAGNAPVRAAQGALHSVASISVCAASHCGSTPACTISQPCICSASGRARSQSSSSRGRAPQDVGPACRCGAACARHGDRQQVQVVVAQQAVGAAFQRHQRRSTASDSGPRLTRSPSRYQRVAAG